MAGVVGVAHDAVAVDDKSSRHLECVADDLLNVVALSGRLHPSHKDGWTKNLPHGAAREAESLITRAEWIREARERHLKTITQGLRLLWIALRDGHNVAAGSFDVLGALTELRQVLPAEGSAEVPEEG